MNSGLMASLNVRTRSGNHCLEGHLRWNLEMSTVSNQSLVE